MSAIARPSGVPLSTLMLGADRIAATIAASMRAAPSMSVECGTPDGRAIADTYRLRGAATAIDAAALGCARLR